MTTGNRPASGALLRQCAKEVRFPGFRPDGDGERRAVAPITAASEMRRRWCVKKEVVAVRDAP